MGKPAKDAENGRIKAFLHSQVEDWVTLAHLGNSHFHWESRYRDALGDKVSIGACSGGKYSK